MSIDAANTVLDAIVGLCGPEGARHWPPPCERPILEKINTWIALREGDKATLKRVADWKDQRREYRIDGLPERMADAWAHFIAGEEPTITPAAEADTALLENLLEEDFASELERGVGLCVSEGEIWARGYVDPLVAPRPLMEWISRANVVPYWIGTRLAGAAVVTEVAHPAEKSKLLRLLEVHVEGTVLNALFEGNADKLGERVDLAEYSEQFGDLEPEWDHGLPFSLLVRIPNRLRRNRRIGVSDFDTVLDNLLDLNEAAAIGAHNMRLTARKRAVITAAAARTTTGPRDDLALTPEETAGANAPPRPRFDTGEEVFVEDPLDGELGKEAKDPFRIIEYSFDAQALIAWKLDLVETALTRCGLSAQYVGVNAGQEGYAISGTALRLRLIPTTSTGRGKRRYWATGLPRILTMLQALDALDTDLGGFGRPWNSPLEAPVVELEAGIPTDELEEATRHQTLVNAGLESKAQAIRELHPDWDDATVEAEVKAINDEAPAGGSMFGLPTGA